MKQKRKFGMIFVGVLLFANFIFFGNIQEVQAIEYEFLGAKPAFPDPNVKNSESWFIYDLEPGDAIQDGVIAMNLFQEDLDVLIYAADSIRSSSGGFAFKQYVEPKEKVGSWLKFYPNDPPNWFRSTYASLDEKIITACELEKEDIKNVDVTDEQFEELNTWCDGVESIETNLKSEEQRFIPFVFSVPDDPSLDIGEHTGAVAIQKKATDTQQDGDQSAVRLTMRLGVRIYQTIPGDITKSLTLANVKVDKNYKEFDYTSWFKKETKPENYIFSVEAVNTESNVSILFKETTQIHKIFPSGKAEESERSFQVLRGDTFISNFSWENPRFGKYAFDKEITYENTEGETIVLNTDTITILIMPWREIAIVAIVLAFIAIGYAWWRIRLKKIFGGIGWEHYTVQEDDDINTLAKEHKIDWLVLAKTNKLKPPYILEPGQKILLPPGENTISYEELQRDTEHDDKKEIQIPGSSEAVEPKRSSRSYLIWMIGILVGIAIIGLFVLATRDKKTISLETSISMPKAAPASEEIENPNSIAEESVQQNVDVEPDAPVEETEDASTTEEIIQDETEETIEEEKEDVNEEELFDLKVQVLNGGAPSGSAGAIKATLEDRGFTSVDAKNASEEQSGNTIYYKSGGADIVEMFSDILVDESVAEMQIVEDTALVEQENAVFVIFLGK